MKLIDKIRRRSYDCDGMCGSYDICKRCDSNRTQTIYKYRSNTVRPQKVNRTFFIVILIVVIFLIIMISIFGMQKL